LKVSQQSEVESRLIGLLRQAESLYRRALSAIQRSIPMADPDAEVIMACLVNLEPLMRQTQELELSLAPCRQAWTQLGVPGSPELQAVFQQQRQLLGELLGRINELEDRLRQLRQRAIPEVDTVLRHRQMQRAYQQAARV